jgi:ABC-type lipoprotein export system ATPase subunit
MEFAIVVKGLLHVYDIEVRRFAVHVPELNIPKGKLTTIIGSSGSGKSTLLGRISLILDPSMRSRLDAFTITESIPKEDIIHDIALSLGKSKQLESIRKRLMGFYLQGGELISTLTLIENVSMPLRLNGFSSREALLRSRELLSFLLGVAPELVPNKLGHESSGGEAQRVAVARAIAHHPQFLFVDEPTSSLDDPNKCRVLDLLKKQVSADNTTIVMVTHDLYLADQYSDYIIEMEAQPGGWGNLLPHQFRDCDGFGKLARYRMRTDEGWVYTNSRYEPLDGAAEVK